MCETSVKELLLLFLIAIFTTDCSSDKQSNIGLPFIDVKKNYPEKEIILTDMEKNFS